MKVFICLDCNRSFGERKCTCIKMPTDGDCWVNITKGSDFAPLKETSRLPRIAPFQTTNMTSGMLQSERAVVSSSKMRRSQEGQQNASVMEVNMQQSRCWDISQFDHRGTPCSALRNFSPQSKNDCLPHFFEVTLSTGKIDYSKSCTIDLLKILTPQPQHPFENQ